MTTANDGWETVASSGVPRSPAGLSLDDALKAEGLTGRLADVARSIYQQESSGGRNTATSYAGAVGPMQVIPATFGRFSERGWDINNPEQNIRAGLRYIKALDPIAGGDPRLIAAGYYGGEGAIPKAARGIPVADPRNPNAPNTLQYADQVAARLPPAVAAPSTAGAWETIGDVKPVTPAAPATAAPQRSFMDSLTDSLGTHAIAAKMAAGDVGNFIRNNLAGQVRGAASIGSTILAPIDMATDYIKGDRGPNVTGLVTGQQPISRNAERRQSVNDFLRDTIGADTTSIPFGVGKVGAEIAGTAGVGNLLALPLRAAAPTVATALQSGGMTLGPQAVSSLGVRTLGQRAADMALRTGAGAIVGGASAGLVDPSTAGTGAIIGGVLPGGVALAGTAGSALNRFMSGPAQTPDAIAAIRAARDAGYVIPPTQAKPSLLNRTLEGVAGKATTAQNASARNAGVTADLVAREVGLPAGTKITVPELDRVRQQAGQAYEAVANTGMVTPSATYFKALDAITKDAKSAAQSFPNAKVNPIIETVEALKTQQFDARSGLAMLRELRAQADTAYAAGDKALGRSLKNGAAAIENALDEHLMKIGAPADMLQQFREARQLIAKTYSVQGALNPTTGAVDARKLASDLKRGKPLSGGLRDAAEFAGRFPKAAQNVEQMGSLPQISPLDWALGFMGATQNPLLFASTLARPAMRAAALSGPVQNRLAMQPAQGPTIQNVNQFLANPVIRNALYASAANP